MLAGLDEDWEMVWPDVFRISMFALVDQSSRWSPMGSLLVQDGSHTELWALKSPRMMDLRDDGRSSGLNLCVLVSKSGLLIGGT